MAEKDFDKLTVADLRYWLSKLDVKTTTRMKIAELRELYREHRRATPLQEKGSLKVVAGDKTLYEGPAVKTVVFEDTAAPPVNHQMERYVETAKQIAEAARLSTDEMVFNILQNPDHIQVVPKSDDFSPPVKQVSSEVQKAADRYVGACLRGDECDPKDADLIAEFFKGNYGACIRVEKPVDPYPRVIESIGYKITEGSENPSLFLQQIGRAKRRPLIADEEDGFQDDPRMWPPKPDYNVQHPKNSFGAQRKRKLQQRGVKCKSVGKGRFIRAE